MPDPAIDRAGIYLFTSLRNPMVSRVFAVFLMAKSLEKSKLHVMYPVQYRQIMPKIVNEDWCRR